MSQDKMVLVLGASKHTYRYSYLASMRLMENGFPVYLLGTTGGTIMDQPIVKEFPMDLPVDTVTLYLSERNQKDYVDSLISISPRRIIFNPGAENYELFRKAENAGIEPLEACTLVMLAGGTF